VVKTDYSLLKKHHAAAHKMPHLCSDESNTLVWFDFWSCFCSGAGNSAPEWFYTPRTFSAVRKAIAKKFRIFANLEKEYGAKINVGTAKMEGQEP
jgi:hypothetical protein